ncbi:hypothetical protein H0E87_025176 [Populus deltoides]|uniref:Uncharacterized protein n=1 Tax=Populus deltoides TaxID=3696 RepID=A0A8T2XBT0_POPDE|nr:hypothetical protein H0E87_025176 [Populus deltoides]
MTPLLKPRGSGIWVEDSREEPSAWNVKRAPNASRLWLTVLAGLKRSCRTVGENLVVMGRSQKERRRGRGFGFLVVRVIEGRCVSVLRMEMERGMRVKGKVCEKRDGAVTLNGVLWFCMQGKNGDGELTERRWWNG